jgi:hypothetical protein
MAGGATHVRAEVVRVCGLKFKPRTGRCVSHWQNCQGPIIAKRKMLVLWNKNRSNAFG